MDNKSRQEKIELAKGLVTGKIQLQDIEPAPPDLSCLSDDELRRIVVIEDRHKLGIDPNEDERAFIDGLWVKIRNHKPEKQ